MRSSRFVLGIKPRNGDNIVAIEMASNTCKLPSLEGGSSIQESHITIATISDEITEANRRI